jgi:hypothetical protein
MILLQRHDGELLLVPNGGLRVRTDLVSWTWAVRIAIIQEDGSLW